MSSLPPSPSSSSSSPPPPPPPSLLSLHNELLSNILSRLSLPDRSRFASTSTSTNSLSHASPRVPLPPSLPFLLRYSPPPSSYDLFDPSSFRHYRLPRDSPLAHDPTLISLSSSASHPFLLAVSLDHHLFLIKPFTTSLSPPLSLPPLFHPPPCSSCHYHIITLYSKAAVHVSRSTGRFTVVVLPNTNPPRLAFLREGEDNWRFLRNPNGDNHVGYCDIAVCREIWVLALEFGGRLNVWDIAGSPRLKMRIECGRPRELVLVQRYLVVARDEEVLLVWRWIYEARFRVFRMEGRRWVEMVGSLGDYVLFLSRFSSMAVDASEVGGLVRERIYYLEKDEEWECFAYNFVGRTVERVCDQDEDLRPPIWVMPSLE